MFGSEAEHVSISRRVQVEFLLLWAACCLLLPDLTLGTRAEPELQGQAWRGLRSPDLSGIHYDPAHGVGRPQRPQGKYFSGSSKSNPPPPGPFVNSLRLAALSPWGLGYRRGLPWASVTFFQDSRRQPVLDLR